MPHLLVLSHRWPEQQACSAGQHLQQILQTFLARGWQVTFASSAQTGERKADLAALGVLEQHISTDNAAFLTSQTADVVLFDSFTSEERYASQVTQHIPQALRVLLTGGLQSLRETRQQLLRRRLIEGLDPNDFRALFATSGPDLYRHMAPLDLTQRELAAIWRWRATHLASRARPAGQRLRRAGVPAALLPADGRASATCARSPSASTSCAWATSPRRPSMMRCCGSGTTSGRCCAASCPKRSCTSTAPTRLPRAWPCMRRSRVCM
jgi:hypothetical protein